MSDLRIGSTVYKWARLTEVTGEDITGIAVHMAVAPLDAGVPQTWATLERREHPDPSTVRAAILVTPTEVGLYGVWIRPSDTPEVEPILAGTFRVTT